MPENPGGRVDAGRCPAGPLKSSSERNDRDPLLNKYLDMTRYIAGFENAFSLLHRVREEKAEDTRRDLEIVKERFGRAMKERRS